MIAWLALLLLVAAGLGLGWLVVRQFVGDARPRLSLLFVALVIGVVALGWSALVLAEFRLFSVGRLGLVWLVAAATLLSAEAWHRRAGRWPTVDEMTNSEVAADRLPLPRWFEAVFLALWLAAAGWLFFRPHEQIAGAADAGVYVNLSASIARTGGIVIHDETLVGLDPSLLPALLRPLPAGQGADYYLFPGFYVVGRPPGEVTPQFYPLHPVWQAAGFALAERLGGQPDGVRAALLMPGLWALLGGLAVYLTTRQFAGRLAAALALVGLSLTALQVWFARYPTAETLTQFLLWSGLFALGMWLGRVRPGRLWAFAAGLAFGAVFLVRVDILALLPVLGLLGLVLLISGRRLVTDRGEVAWFLVPLLGLVAHSFIHAYWQSRPYFVVHFGYGLQLLLNNWPVLLVAGLAALVGLWLVLRVARTQSRPALADAYARYRHYALAALIGAALVFAVYGWFIRPALGETVLRPDLYTGGEIPLTDHENWLRLGWYLSPLGVWLGVAGACVLIGRVDRRTVVMLAVGALFSALYLWSLRANPHQIYAMRRFVPVVVPFFMVAAAAFIDWLARRPRRWAMPAAVLLAIVWLAGLGWSARGFISQVDYSGLTAELAALDATLEPDSVLIFNDQATIGGGDFFGTPLQYIFGHDVFTLRDLARLRPGVLVNTIKAWQNSGRAVYWVGDPAWLSEQGLAYQESTATLRSQHLETRYDRKPTAILQDEWTLRISKIEPSG